jgi:cell division protein FtsL
MCRHGPLALLIFFSLWAAVVISSFAVVLSTYQVRSQVNELAQLQREASNLRVEWGRFLLEQSTWGSYQRIESMALERLQMQAPSNEQITIIIDDIN